MKFLFLFQGLFKSLRIVEQKFGSMFFDFGEPISAREYFSDKLQRSVHAVEPANVQILSKLELSYIQDLANEVSYIVLLYPYLDYITMSVINL